MGTIDEAWGNWVTELGYDQVEGAFVRDTSAVDIHPFAPELRAIFRPDQGIAAGAVFCVDRVPTVCLVASSALPNGAINRSEALRNFCERLWNQNLARVLLVLEQGSLEAWSIDNPYAQPERFTSEQKLEASTTWSVSGLLGGEALKGRDAWFNPAVRVDKILLDNVLVLVNRLAKCGVDAAAARRLVARLIFIVYLEDRKIISAAYRKGRKVKPLCDLMQDRDSAGIEKLIRNLRTDFNGDFLTSADGEGGWKALTPEAFQWMSEFLGRTTLRSGQLSFWRYDFSQIPIELVAGIYETFLASKDDGLDRLPADKAKRRQGAYYTPRHLADWVVDLVTEGRDPLEEQFFDGACGSGMLLTAAFRRLIRAHEARSAHSGLSAKANFDTRCTLLLNHIFGGDIDEDACQLTSFSLYLALLGDLSPRDLTELRQGGRKLPNLTKNIRRGALGNFFSAARQEQSDQRFSIFLSNPPWRELSVSDPAAQILADWRERQSEPKPHIPKRQIAAAFALGAADVIEGSGRVVLILPVTLFVSADPTQRDFRAHLLGRYKVKTIVNFSDMRHLIFADAAHPFVVLIAEPRDRDMRFKSIEAEAFEYWTPKTDISLALGRLVVHGADRANLPASALIDEDAQLAIRYWGSESDVTLLQRLRRHGTIANLVGEQGWAHAKGFHLIDEDKRRPPSTWYREIPTWLSKIPFLRANMLPSDLPIVPAAALESMPYSKLARVPDDRLFSGPRILWTDGAHPTDGVKAVYADEPFSFQSSLAVLSAPRSEEGRLTARFLTAYFRSPLGLWLLLLLSSSVASERPKLHMIEALKWPFWSLIRHPNRVKAELIMAEVDALLKTVEVEEGLLQSKKASEIQGKLNRHVYNFFELSCDDIAMIEELANFAGPALQPASVRHGALMRPARQAPTDQQMRCYCEQLTTSIRQWRDVTGGEGELYAAPWSGKSVPIGAAVLTLNAGSQSDRLRDDAVIHDLLAAIAAASSLSVETLLTIPDLAIVDDRRIFVIKPLVSRFWLKRCAVEDAGRLAIQLQSLFRKKMSA